MNELELVNIIIDLMKFIEQNGLKLGNEKTSHIADVFERRLENVRV